MAGRKLKLTPEVQAEIVRALGVGATQEHAALYAGISVPCFYAWLKKAEEGRSPYVEFLEAVKKAESRAVVGWLAQIEEAARTGSWQAAAWKLERRYFKDFGRQVVEHAGHGQPMGPVEFVLKVVYASEREDTPGAAPGRGSHPPQIPAPAAAPFLSPARRSVKLSGLGRRGGKTTGLAILAVQQFLLGHRILYAVPTQEQVQRFWHEVTMALAAPITMGLFAKNETLHTIERPRTEQRIRAKTAWSPDTLRGDYASVLDPG